MSKVAAHRLGLQAQPKSRISVSVANGQKLQSQGICKAIKFVVGNTCFTADFLIIPLDGFDVVLEV